MFKIWLKSFEFEGIMNIFKDGLLCWRFGGCLTFLTGADVLDHDWDVSLKVLKSLCFNFCEVLMTRS